MTFLAEYFHIGSWSFFLAHEHLNGSCVFVGLDLDFGIAPGEGRYFFRRQSRFVFSDRNGGISDVGIICSFYNDFRSFFFAGIV